MADMTGFERLDVGVSSNYKQMWWKLDDPLRCNGTLRVEFKNRKVPEARGAIYDYKVSEEFVDGLVELAGEIGGETVGERFVREAVKQPALVPCTLVERAE